MLNNNILNIKLAVLFIFFLFCHKHDPLSYVPSTYTLESRNPSIRLNFAWVWQKLPRRLSSNFNPWFSLAAEFRSEGSTDKLNGSFLLWSVLHIFPIHKTFISLYKKSTFPALNCAPRKYGNPDLAAHVNQNFQEKVFTILGTIIADISHNRWCTFFKRCTFGIESAKFWPVLAISGYFVANISTFWQAYSAVL